MTAILTLQDQEVMLQGDPSANSRPMQPLIDAINSLGGKCYSKQNNGLAPLYVRGNTNKKFSSLSSCTIFHE